MRAVLLAALACAAALMVAPLASSKGQMPEAWVLTPAVDLELALGSYCFNASEATPVWLRGKCKDAAPPQTRADLPRPAVPCGKRAVFEFLYLQSLTTLTLQVGKRSFQLKPRGHWSEPYGTYFTARWRIHGHSGLLTLTATGEQGRIAYHARLRIRHPGCR